MWTTFTQTMRNASVAALQQCVALINYLKIQISPQLPSLPLDWRHLRIFRLPRGCQFCGFNLIIAIKNI